MDEKKIPGKILTCFFITSQPDGGKHKFTRDAIYENINKLLLTLPKR